MEKQTITLGIIMSLVLISLVSSMLPQPVVQGNCVNIKVPYNSTSLNITTITPPNQTLIFINVIASLNGSTFFYDGFCDTDELGIYTYEFLASDGFTSGNSFLVTPTGDELGGSQGPMYITLLIVNLVFLIIFIYFSIIIKFGNKTEKIRNGILVTKVTKTKYIKLLLMWFSYYLFVWLITLIAGIVNNYIFFQPLKDMAISLYLFVSAMGYAVSLTMIVIIFVNIWRDIILNKTIINEGKAFLFNSK